MDIASIFKNYIEMEDRYEMYEKPQTWRNFIATYDMNNPRVEEYWIEEATRKIEVPEYECNQSIKEIVNDLVNASQYVHIDGHSIKICYL